MKDNLQPYVGVAAIRYGADVLLLADCRRFLDYRQVLALGYQVSSKTIRGEKNRYPEVFPTMSGLESLLKENAAVPGVEHHLHFFSDDPKKDLEKELLWLADNFGSDIDGLQLNVAWPDPDLLQAWKDRFPRHRIILSLNREAITTYPATDVRSSKLTPGEVESIIGEHYLEWISNVLWDLSGGQGRPASIDDVHEYLGRIRHSFPKLGLGVAGGLGPRKLQLISRLLPGYWPFSWDAQSQLYRNDRAVLDVRKTKMYIQESGYLPYEAGV